MPIAYPFVAGTAACLDDEEDDTMPPKKAPPPPLPKKKLSTMEDVEEKFGKMDVSQAGTALPYDFNTRVPTVVTQFTLNDKDIVEVAYWLNPVGQDFIKTSLENGGMDTALTLATPKLFGETGRMKVQMKQRFKKNHSRVIAFNKVVGKVREDFKGTQGKLWGKPQITALPVQCEGQPKKSFDYIPTGQQVRIKRGDTEYVHNQYCIVLSLFYKVAKKMMEKEKLGRVSICAAPSADSEDSEAKVDQDDVADDEEGEGMH